MLKIYISALSYTVKFADTAKPCNRSNTIGRFFVRLGWDLSEVEDIQDKF